MKQPSTAIVWFRQDLRLSDNPALSMAQEKHEHVIPVYIHAPAEAAPWAPGAASNWWLHESLKQLDQALQKTGSYLLLKTGDSLDTLQSLVKQHNVQAVYWNRVYEPALIKRDKSIKSLLRSAGIDCHSYNALLLNEPHTIKNKAGSPFKVFSAYWRNASQSLSSLQAPLAAPQQINSPGIPLKDNNLDKLSLLPAITWYQPFYQHWQPGEQGAHHRLNSLLEYTLPSYPTDRELPSIEGSSRLSAHLHFGEISARQIVTAIKQFSFSGQGNIASQEKFLAELGWREFAYYQLYHFPDSCNQSLDNRFDKHGWIDASENEQWLESWKKGTTGIPLVDAGMRELWHTGWMHNRVRMITASILSKNMGVNWLTGARWFWDTLLDADLASNTMGWQWTAGCGVDAAPYFRVFSPARQTERFDPQGEYIRKWIPELETVDKKILINGLQEVHPHINYPLPVIDLSESRKSALARWDQIRHSQKAEKNHDAG